MKSPSGSINFYLKVLTMLKMFINTHYRDGTCWLIWLGKFSCIQRLLSINGSMPILKHSPLQMAGWFHNTRGTETESYSVRHQRPLIVFFSFLIDSSRFFCFSACAVHLVYSWSARSIRHLEFNREGFDFDLSAGIIKTWDEYTGIFVSDQNYKFPSPSI